MLKWFMADLHIHTCLSPCGDLQMTPQKIIKQALERKLDVIAICDHNSGKNLNPIIKLGSQNGLSIIPGMEICSSEEVHVLGLFNLIESALEMQNIVYENLNGENDPDIFGMQVIGNESDEVEGFENKLLIGAVDLTLEEIVNHIHQLDGIVIASHIDRESYSVIGQLGFIPDSVKFDGLEVSASLPKEKLDQLKVEFSNYQLIQNSDAHFLNDIGKCTTQFFIKEPTFEEIKKAFKKINGRKISIN
ncbi:MAG: PHP domain-containing protein [Bacteroidetes bacterium]|nr:PHP domain-containing protein [Bacteroidota bacterium]